MDANEFSCRTASPRRKHDVAHCTTALCPAEIKSRWTYKEILEVKPASLPMDYISFLYHALLYMISFLTYFELPFQVWEMVNVTHWIYGINFWSREIMTCQWCYPVALALWWLFEIYSPLGHQLLNIVGSRSSPWVCIWHAPEEPVCAVESPALPHNSQGPP